MTENYCLQELVAQLDDMPFYWTSGNLAEVDFVAQFTDKIVPIEVKAAFNAKSTQIYSTLILEMSRSCPVYMLWKLSALLGRI